MSLFSKAPLSLWLISVGSIITQLFTSRLSYCHYAPTKDLPTGDLSFQARLSPGLVWTGIPASLNDTH